MIAKESQATQNRSTEECTRELIDYGGQFFHQAGRDGALVQALVTGDYMEGSPYQCSVRAGGKQQTSDVSRARERDRLCFDTFFQLQRDLLHSYVRPRT